uniref:Uncharacterized protein n=1 Tax=Catagonus wagneri TaxID=51154 RepID=A0A8C4FEB1_9CETA
LFSKARAQTPEGILSFKMPCAIVLPLFLALFFRLHPPYFKLQMPKKYANRHYITPVAATQIFFIGCS